MDAVVLALRVLLSLTVVLGLLWYLHRKISRFNRTGNKADPVTVVTRQGISPKASVVMIEADGRRFLLGVTDQSVNVLHTSPAPGLTSVPGLTSESDAAGADDVGGATFARVLSLATAAGQPGSESRPARRRAGTPVLAEAANFSPTNINRANVARAEVKRSGRRAAHASTGRAASPLAGSILSAETWKQTAAAFRQGRTG
ncbi:flagellar biosynthetic protein FliO [Arthrobacter sp. H20]|uniref:FliO/MopB family protein n=1 Tax=Arthrobacter sp. H20 TaxID=1267981 RepID=UPI0004B6B874|nr:flagellar biosynthetic protein FliO [Arthrobacter sp. H20]